MYSNQALPLCMLSAAWLRLLQHDAGRQLQYGPLSHKGPYCNCPIGHKNRAELRPVSKPDDQIIRAAHN